MMKYNWKEEYYHPYSGIPLISAGYNVIFTSPLGSGNGSRRNPSNNKLMSVNNNFIVFASGFSKSHIKGTNIGYILGATDNMRDTHVDLALDSGANLYKMTVEKVSAGGKSVTCFYCDIKELVSASLGYARFSILRFNTLNNYVMATNNTYIGLDNMSLYSNSQSASVFTDCNMTVTNANWNKDQYTAFNDCRFKMGNETDFTPLNGETEEELRADFVRRYEAQYGNAPVGSEYGENSVKFYRWVFAKNSMAETAILPGSMIHNFEKRRNVRLGHNTFREFVGVAGTNKKNSFNPGNPGNTFLYGENALTLSDDFDTTLPLSAVSTSNIVSLGGKKAFTRFQTVENFLQAYGVQIDTTPNLGNSPVTRIEMGEDGTVKNYLLRSANEDIATVTYNNRNYTSSLADRNNVISSIKELYEYSASENALLYEVLDEIQYQTIQMRVANKIPLQQITSGNLQAGYWYLVEHDSDQANETDYVTFSGKDYYVGDSFLCPSATSFTRSGNVHLRRCWREDFNFATESTDKTFWQNEQKPEWMEVIASDPRCLMKNNNVFELEMQRGKDGKYITSGHPEFYDKIVGTSGIRIPFFPIQGAYMQLRIKLTTQNPM